MKFINKIQKFMYGRYARSDELYKFLFWLYIFLFIIDLFINSNILLIIQLSILFIIIFRFFSKNIYKRNKENQKFINLKKNITKPFINIKRNINDKDHIYKKCHKCKTVLKLPIPSERGIKIAKCPHCKNRVKVLALKKLKIEVIKKN